jgi:hypothetical protein
MRRNCAKTSFRRNRWRIPCANLQRTLNIKLTSVCLICSIICFSPFLRPFLAGHAEVADVVDTVCDAVFEIGDLTLALEEIPHYCTAGSVPEALVVLARMGRHRRVDLIFTGQRFAEPPRRLTTTTDYLGLFGQREPRDLDALAERVGRELAERVAGLPLHGRLVYDVVAGHCVPENG